MITSSSLGHPPDADGRAGTLPSAVMRKRPRTVLKVCTKCMANTNCCTSAIPCLLMVECGPPGWATYNKPAVYVLGFVSCCALTSCHVSRFHASGSGEWPPNPRVLPFIGAVMYSAMRGTSCILPEEGSLGEGRGMHEGWEPALTWMVYKLVCKLEMGPCKSQSHMIQEVSFVPTTTVPTSEACFFPLEPRSKADLARPTTQLIAVAVVQAPSTAGAITRKMLPADSWSASLGAPVA